MSTEGFTWDCTKHGQLKLRCIYMHTPNPSCIPSRCSEINMLAAHLTNAPLAHSRTLLAANC